MKYIKKFLIKNYENTEDAKVRLSYGMTAGFLGVITNVLLFIGKIIIGVIGNSISIIADAINNLSDAGSSVITIVGFKISSKPADAEHPYGHARFEYIAALVIAIIVFAVGITLGKSSIEKIINPDVTTISIFTYIVLVLSILLKLFQFTIYKDFSKSINSSTLKASSTDSLNDIISTTVVLISSIIINIVGNSKVSIDGIFGLLVSIYIIYSSLSLMKSIINPLLGQPADPEFIKKIVSEIMSYDGVLGVHDLMVHSYGTGANFVMVHVEVDANVNVLDSHDLIDNIEKDLSAKFGIHVSIHMDPIVTDNEEVTKLKERVEQTLHGLNPNLSFHDFRVVFGTTHTNLIFDVVVPFSENISLYEIKAALISSFKSVKPKVNFVIEEDRSY